MGLLLTICNGSTNIGGRGRSICKMSKRANNFDLENGKKSWKKSRNFEKETEWQPCMTSKKVNLKPSLMSVIGSTYK